MRLLNTSSLELTDFMDNDVPLYAILSHRWGDEEVSLQEIQGHDPRAANKAGYKKILMLCSIAASHGFQYAWIDTCCIDKTSSAELSEAINSMYHWYQESTICYAYLGDVTDCFSMGDGDDSIPAAVLRPDSDFHNSSWFSRGWTLQELLAPSIVIFFDAAWKEIGTKSRLCPTLSQITGIPEAILAGQSPETASIAQRMSWASSRRTTRIEDTAYCLMGLFNVNMPMLYGEGEKAFMRLQEEIIKVSDDYTIFAWGSERWGLNDSSGHGGLLATSPADFASCRDMVPWGSLIAQSSRSRVILSDNKGIHLKVNFVPGNAWNDLHTAILPCGRTGYRGWARIGIPLKAMSPSLECFIRPPFLPFRELPHDNHLEYKYPERQICVARRNLEQRRSRRLQMLKAAECGNREVVQLLLNQDARDTSIEARDELTQRTPLLGAAGCGHAGVVELLARHGANVEAVDGKGCTPLVLAALGEHEEVVRVLLNWGADPEVKMGGMLTPLLWAAQEGAAGVVSLLIQGGANVEAVDDGGRTPLLWAAARGHEAAARMLVKSGARLEVADGGGCTALLCAAESGLAEIVQLLVEAGANLVAVDGNGNSALRLALRRGHAAVIRLLGGAGDAAVRLILS